MADHQTSNGELSLVLADLELERKKIALNKIWGWVAVAISILCVLLGAQLNLPEAGLTIGIISFITGAILLYGIQNKFGAYKVRFKKDVIGNAISSIDPNLAFEPYNGISEREFVDAQLFTIPTDRYSSEDLVRGRMEKTGFYFSEAHAEYKTQVPTKNGTRTVWHTLFKGIVFVADFNKNFNGITLLRPRDTGSSIRAWFSKNIYSFGNSNVVELENEYFNKNFVVYGTDQIEARYILTPSMMEKITDLNERSAYCLSMSFINSCLYIAFPLDQDYFEPPLFKTLMRPNLLENDLSVLHFMYDIIAELDLNTRIWTKE